MSEHRRAMLPEAMKRPAVKPEGMSDWDYMHSWELLYPGRHIDQYAHRLIPNGWVVAGLKVDEIRDRVTTMDEDKASRAAERMEMERLADMFIQTGSFLEQVLPAKRERALEIVAARLREVSLSPFLVDALLALSPAPPASTIPEYPEEGR